MSILAKTSLTVCLLGALVWLGFTAMLEGEHILLIRQEAGLTITAFAQNSVSTSAGWDLFVRIANRRGTLYEGVVIKSVDELSDFSQGDVEVKNLDLDPTQQSLTITFSKMKPITIPVTLGKFEEGYR